MNIREANKLNSYSQIVGALSCGARVYHYCHYWNAVDEVLICDTSSDTTWPAVRVVGNTGERTHCTNLFNKGDVVWFE